MYVSGELLVVDGVSFKLLGVYVLGAEIDSLMPSVIGMDGTMRQSYGGTSALEVPSGSGCELRSTAYPLRITCGHSGMKVHVYIETD